MVKGYHALRNCMNQDPIEIEMIDTVVDVIIDLNVLDHTTGFYITIILFIMEKDYPVIGHKREIPHALLGCGLIGRPRYILVLVTGA